MMMVEYSIMLLFSRRELGVMEACLHSLPFIYAGVLMYI